MTAINKPLEKRTLIELREAYVSQVACGGDGAKQFDELYIRARQMLDALQWAKRALSFYGENTEFVMQAIAAAKGEKQ